MRRWVSRLAKGLLALLVIGLTIGTSWEFWQRREAERRFPLPGKRVDIGGRSLYLDCRGAGSPTVILEAGLDPAGALAWRTVHDSLATISRTCAYSRAGSVGSDERPDMPTPERIVSDLHALLKAAHIDGPLVMAGHSLGGPLLTQYTMAHPTDVHGIVMVDASHPDQITAFARALGKPLPKPPILMFRLASMFAWTGLPRRVLLGEMTLGSAYLPLHIDGGLDELEAVEQLIVLPTRPPSLGDRPMIVITAGKEDDIEMEQQMMQVTRAQVLAQHAAWDSLQIDMSRWSSRGKRIVLPKSSHYVQYDRPDVVIGAVRDVVETVRAQSGTPVAGAR